MPCWSRRWSDWQQPSRNFDFRLQAKRPEQLNSCSGRILGEEKGESSERDVQTGVDDIVVLPYFDNRGGVVDQAVGASDADGGRDVVLEIDGGAEAGLSSSRCRAWLGVWPWW